VLAFALPIPNLFSALAFLVLIKLAHNSPDHHPRSETIEVGAQRQPLFVECHMLDRGHRPPGYEGFKHEGVRPVGSGPFMVTVLWGRSIIALQASNKSKPKFSLSSIRVTQTPHFVVFFPTVTGTAFTIRPATGWLPIPVSCTTSQLACKYGNRDSSAKVIIAAVFQKQ
jgi:hypothetical protein